MSGHSIEAIAGALLFLGSLLAIPWTAHRFLFYCFAFVAFSTYFVLGPEATLLVLGTALLAGASHWARARLSRSGWTEDSTDRLRSLFPAAAAASLAMLVTHVARRLLGQHAYPLPLATAADLGGFVASLVFLFAVYTVTKGAISRFAPGPGRAADPPPPGFETSTSLHLIIGVVGVPIHVAAQAAYVRGATLPWIGVLLWSLLMNGVISHEVARMRRVEQLVRQLATRERLAAIGEITARVVHQTRHQLGLIGIIMLRIERRISALSESDAEVVRGELQKLGEVQRELSDMLTRDLRGERSLEPSPPAAPSSYAAIVAEIAGRLEGLAASRGIKLDVGEVTVAETFAPRDARNVGRAVFNVLENAIVAATKRVGIEASLDGEQLVVAVRDDGPGVPENLLKHAMDPFVTTKPDGTGMGLAIAQAAVREEGGTLRLVNEPQGGLRVDFLIPRSPSGP